MKTFLQYVAEDILSKLGTDLSHVTVVFPNKRASHFLNDHIARLANRPVWSPSYLSISELFALCTKSTIADPLKLVCDLHCSFTAQTGIDETLDHFFSWGQLLLNDFDDIDKHLAPADKVLANLRDLHELDDASYLTEEQKQAIRQFFSSFTDDHNSQLKERFIRLWSHIADIYHDFNRRLDQQGLAYEGKLYREVVEAIESGNKPAALDSQFVFIGFNMLQPVEQRLFRFLQQEGRARFYWDFDRYYMNSQNEAGQYLKPYLELFPNELDSRDDTIYNNLCHEKKLTFISAPTENIQARYASQWLDNDTADSPYTPSTAVVLCDEGLLQTLTHCLPDSQERVNITTGYPLQQSPVASLISHLIALRTQGYDPSRDRFRLRQVNAVLRHPYVTSLSPLLNDLQKDITAQHIYYPSAEQLTPDEGLALLFHPFNGSEPLVPQLLQWLCDVMQGIARSCISQEEVKDASESMMSESLFRAYTLLNRLSGLVQSGDLTVDVVTLQRLIQQLVQSASIPFEGEPVEGLQIMGMLETRCLDFRRVLILSCNEGNMPRGVSDTSFIPYSIRKAYGLTTIDHKVALQSYYFHRLLQRAEEVTIVYNNATSDGQRNEMSRFLLQLMVEYPHPISFQTLRAGQTFTPFQPPTVGKTREVMTKLMERFRLSPANQQKPTPLLTPTAINRYQRCPLQFYYCYVCDLVEPDETEDDTIDNRIFGNIFHEASRLLYSQLMDKSHEILKEDIDALLRTKTDIEMAVDQAFQQELFHQPVDEGPESLRQYIGGLNGLQLINREVIIHYLRLLLQLDHHLAPFTILGLECDVMSKMKVTPNDEGSSPFTTTIGGRIDRLDQVTDANGEEHIRVVDYKTGFSRFQPLADVDAIFLQESLSQHSDYYLQTFLYGCLVRSEHKDIPVSPALLFIQQAGSDDYDPTLCFGKNPINDVADSSQRFGELLRETVNEMFSADIPFIPTDDRDRCRFCVYRNLCAL